MSEIGKQIIQAVRDVAAAKPEYVYKGLCFYVLDGCPACLIGQALWNLGLISAAIEYRSGNRGGVEEMFEDLGIAVDPDEQTWLELAQDAQDSEKPWGESVRRADDYDPAALEMW